MRTIMCGEGAVGGVMWHARPMRDWYAQMVQDNLVSCTDSGDRYAAIRGYFVDGMYGKTARTALDAGRCLDAKNASVLEQLGAVPLISFWSDKLRDSMLIASAAGVKWTSDPSHGYVNQGLQVRQ